MLYFFYAHSLVKVFVVISLIYAGFICISLSAHEPVSLWKAFIMWAIGTALFYVAYRILRELFRRSRVGVKTWLGEG